MITPTSTQRVPTGAHIALEASGSVPVYYPDSVLRENLNKQLLMMGLVVETLTVTSGYGIATRNYVASMTVRVQAATNVAAVVGIVRDALEGAGSYTPTVTVPSIGEPEQPKLPTGGIGTAVEKTLEELIAGVGTAGKGLAESPSRLFTGINVLAIGLVVIVALVAFGPNVKSLAGAVPR